MVFQKVKVTLEMIYQVYEVIYLVHQIRNTDILGLSKICYNGLPYTSCPCPFILVNAYHLFVLFVKDFDLPSTGGYIEE